MNGGAPMPADWGIRPVLFHFGRFAVPAYGAFMVLALAVGLAVYAREAHRRDTMGERSLLILLAAVLGGAIGSKLLVLATDWRAIAAQFPNLGILVSGRSIVGGLIGGAAGVWLLKRRLGIRERKGNLFAPAIAAGVAVGRIGCFLRGCCHGTPTALPWGVDFGEGVPRHPVQVYESLFMLAAFVALTWVRDRARHPAVLFWALMAGYFAFRFAAEFIRVEPRGWLGLTAFQWLSAGLVLAYGARLGRLALDRRREAEEGRA
jgi:phosphatidylglycerol:prolipoprotein diacylglycerol transferase